MEIVPGIPPRAQNVFFSDRSNTTRPFGHLSCTDFDHFWNNDLNRFAGGERREKVPNICAGSFSDPKTHFSVFGWWDASCLCPAYSLNATISGDGSHFRASQHPKDVPCWWVLRGTYGLGAMTPRKQRNFYNDGLLEVTGSHVHCNIVVISRKRCKMESLLLQTTNRKCYMAYRIERMFKVIHTT